MTDKNIVLFLGNDFISLIFLNQFVPKLIDIGFNPLIVNVKSKNHNTSKELQRYDFYQTQLLQDCLYSFIEKTGGNLFNLLTPKQIFTKYNIQTIETNNVNDPVFIKKLSTYDFLGAISLRCFQIFKSDIIDMINKKGFFGNSHPGVLPNYRGVYCMLRGIVNSDRTLGWTLHNIDKGIDTGSIISQTSYSNYSKEESLIPIMAKSVEDLSCGWINFIKDYDGKQNIKITIQQNKGNYYTYPTENEFSHWYQTKKLHPLVPKEIVKFYFDLFTQPDDKFKKEIQNFKVTMITKVAQFETIMEMNDSEIKKPSKKKAA